MIRYAAAAVAAALAAGGCQGEIGTISIAIVTAPGSTVLDPVITLRATLTSPVRTVEAQRGPDGFSLAIEVPADGRGAVVILEGFDAGGAVVAVGATPPLPLAALDADVAVYMAAPQSLAAAPVALDPPRSEIGATLLEYGVLLAGGLAATGPTADLDIYNAYTHSLAPGEDMPDARRGMAVGYSPSGYAYLVGGADAAGQPTGVVWRFNTNAEPDGDYLALDDQPTLARVGQVAAPLGLEQFLITGEPPCLLSGFTGLAAASIGLLLPPLAVSVQDSRVADAPIFTVVVGEGAGATGVVVFTEGVASDVTAPAEAQRTGHGAAPTIDEHVIVIGGGTGPAGLLTSALEVDPIGREVSLHAGALLVGRDDAAVAGNGEVILIAGGTDAGGAVLADAEVVDIATLSHLASIPMVVPRTRASARPLTNGQIMVFGGVDAAGNPVGTIELFTPVITPP